MDRTTFTYLPQPQRREEVERVLRALSEGGTSAGELESAVVDIKEEAGRRAADGSILSGSPRNEEAAERLAEAAACMANSAGGGALVVGVDDKTGRIIGAETDPQWLRSRIYDLTERKLAVQVDRVAASGAELLIIEVPQALEPVPYKGKYQHRVDARCVPATRTELMGALFANLAADPSNMPSQTLIRSITPSAMETLRGQLSDDDSPRAELPIRDLLGRLGLVAEDGEHLNKAGEMLLMARRQPAIDYSYRHVPGGPSIARIMEGGRSLLEEVLTVEARANDHNFVTEVTIGLQVHKVWAIPRRSLREALLNAVCHREWSLPGPTVVEHIGNHLRVTSPGGLIGGVTENNIITHASVPRYRTLMNALRLIGLVEQEGVGVDMMFAEMVRIGSRPPAVTSLPDPAVRIDLYGQPVNENWYRLFADLEPPRSRDDVDAALLVWRGAQPQSPFLTSESCAPLLQRTRGDTEAALQRVAEYRLATPGAPLLAPIAVPYDTPAAWQLSPQAKAALGLQPSTESGQWVLAWARERGRISSGEYREVTGVSPSTATNRLKELAQQGQLVPSSNAGRGRGFHYLPAR